MRYQIFILSFLAYFILMQQAAARELFPIEKEITQYVIKQEEEQLLLLEKLVNINSGSANIPGVQKVGDLLGREFKKLGFKVKWVAEPSYMQRAPSLIAIHTGTKGKRLLLIGHLDTVFPINSPFKKFIRHGNTATGPGVIDDKGGDVIILYALKALYKAHVLDDMNITVVLTGDEEDQGKPTSISRKSLFTAAKNSDVALDFEWATTPNTATIARRGVLHWALKTEGIEGHSAEVFQKAKGFGAIFELTRILNQVRVRFSKDMSLSFNPGMILGGTQVTSNENNSGFTSGKGNVIAKMALAKGDMRFLTDKQLLRAKKQILIIVQQHLPKTNATITFKDGIPAMPPSLNNLKLLQKYNEVSIDLQQGSIKPLNPLKRGAADISHIASIVTANLAGLGAFGINAHSQNETLIISSLPIQTQKAALFIYRLTSVVT